MILAECESRAPNFLEFSGVEGRLIAFVSSKATTLPSKKNFFRYDLITFSMT